MERKELPSFFAIVGAHDDYEGEEEEVCGKKDVDAVMDGYEARIKELEKEVDSVKMNSGYVAFMEAQARIKELEDKNRKLRYERTVWKTAFFEAIAECDSTKPLGKLQQCSDIADALKARANKLKEDK